MGTKKVIDVKHQQQQSSNLCWAACASMFVDYYGEIKSQTTFEAAHNAQFQDGLNVMAAPNETAHLIRSLSNIMVDWKMPAEAVLEWPTLMNMINSDQLIIAGNDGHAFLIVGYEVHETHGNLLFLHDPGKTSGPNAIAYATFKANWKTTVMKKHPVSP